MQSQSIKLERKAGVARVVIDRPPVNVLDFTALGDFSAVLEDISRDSDIGVLLVRGAGTRAFCAGVEVRDHLGERMPAMMERFETVFRQLRKIGKPSIAVVNGLALGGGCEIALGCDMVIAADKASFAQPEIVLGGLAPAAAALLPRMIGQKKAFELIILGDTIGAAEAERIGLVNKVVPEVELDGLAAEMAEKLLTKSRLSVKLVREAFYECCDAVSLEKAIRKGTDLGIASWKTKDGQEGLTAFLEKRKPVWRQQ